MHKLLFICHGNICRSTMAEFVMKHLVSQAGIADDFFIDSAATSREAIGFDVHRGTRKKLQEHGIPCGHHCARQATPDDYSSFDMFICMETKNIRGLEKLLGKDTDGKFKKLLDFAPFYPRREISDPWYTGNFDEAFDDIMAGCKGLLSFLTT